MALVVALAGLGVSLSAAYVHHQLLANPQYASFCDVSATVSCTQAYASRYGSFAGVSVAVYGAIFFAFATLLCLAWLAGPAPVRESAPAYLFAASTLALGVVLYLGYASFVLLKVVCVLCVATYVAVIALFLMTGGATAIPMTSLPRRALQDVRTLAASPVALILAVLFTGTSALGLALFPREAAAPDVASEAAAPADRDPERESEFQRWYTAQPRLDLDIPADGAKVLIVEFSDFHCPYCKQAYEVLTPLIAKYNAQQPGTVRVVLKDYPLDSECNPGVTGGGPHPAACEAAVAARLARERGRGDALEKWLFENQSAAAPTVREAAREIGQVTDFEARYAATLEAVKQDVALGESLGVRSTPTMFINGVRVEGALPSQYLDQAIAYELARAR
jgi:protein-disulfide isomerase/uncharacterized membrane protein